MYTPLPPGEVWGVNGLPRTGEEWDRITRQFQLHPFAVLSRAEVRALKGLSVPTYVIRTSKRFPWAIPYPLQRVGPGPFASSFDYMLALALQEEFQSILLTGIMYFRGTLRERLLEHVSLAYWVGLCRGRGVRVDISRKSTLLKFPWRYGYDYWRERRWGQEQATGALACRELDDGQARRPTRGVKGVRFSGKRRRRS